MRKWSQTIKLNLSERIKEDVEKQYRLELSKDDPTNPFSGQFSEQDQEEVEQRIKSKYDSQLSLAYEDCLNKAQILLKLCIPGASIQEKKSSLELIKTGIQTGDYDNDTFVPEQPNSKVLVHRQSSINEKDSEVDWRDNFRQWQKVQ